MDASTSLPHLLPRLNPNQGCTLGTCPYSDSVFGYRPSLGATIVFLLIFSFSGLAYLIQGIKLRHTWFFTIVMLFGATSEVLGYVAKLLLYHNPFSSVGFKMEVVLLTFAPAFYAAGIYYTLKHLCLTVGPDLSRLPPRLYPWIFIACDIFAIVLQAVGGAISSASSDLSILAIGTNIMISGLVTQVFTLLVFGALVTDYAIAVYRNRQNLNPVTVNLRRTLKFRLFIVALWVAYFGILIRCTYRIAELVHGWTTNPILKSEGLFIGLDSVPVAIAALALNIFHPGWCFPKDTQKAAEAVEKLEEPSFSDEEARVQ